MDRPNPPREGIGRSQVGRPESSLRRLYLQQRYDSCGLGERRSAGPNTELTRQPSKADMRLHRICSVQTFLRLRAFFIHSNKKLTATSGASWRLSAVKNWVGSGLSALLIVNDDPGPQSRAINRKNYLKRVGQHCDLGLGQKILTPLKEKPLLRVAWLIRLFSKRPTVPLHCLDRRGHIFWGHINSQLDSSLNRWG